VPRNAHRGGEHETLDNNNERARYQKHPARPRRPVKQNDGRTPSEQGAPQTRQAPARELQLFFSYDGASTTSSPLFSPQLSQPLLRLPQSSQRTQAQSSSNPSTSPFVSSTCRYNNTLFSRVASVARVFVGSLFISALLFVVGQDVAYATGEENQEQVVVAPALQNADASTNLIELTVTQLEGKLDQIANVITATSITSNAVTTAVDNATTLVSTADTAVIQTQSALANAATALETANATTLTSSQLNSAVTSQVTTVSTLQATSTSANAAAAAANTETTVTETFTNNASTAPSISITVNGSSVNTSNQSGVFIGGGWNQNGIVTGGALSLQGSYAPVVINVPNSDGTVSEVGFGVYAKNGSITGSTTFTDQTGSTFLLQDNVNAQHPGYVHVEVIMAPDGMSIDSITLPANQEDWYIIDNIYYKIKTSDPELSAAAVTAASNLSAAQTTLTNLQTAQSSVSTVITSLDVAETAVSSAIFEVAKTQVAVADAALSSLETTVEEISEIADNLNHPEVVEDDVLEAIEAVNNAAADLQDAQDALAEAVALAADAMTVDAATALVADKQAVYDAALAAANASTVVATVSTPGLIAKVYNTQGQNSAPTIPNNAAPILTTTVWSDPNSGSSFHWGGGQVLNSGRVDDVIVTFEGQITAPDGVDLISFGGYTDDGFKLEIDGQTVINNWVDQGSTWSSFANVDFTGDRTKDIKIWYYENGGGANITFAWSHSGYLTDVNGPALGNAPSGVNPLSYTTTTTTQDPTLVAVKNTALTNLNNANDELTLANNTVSAIATAVDLAQDAFDSLLVAITAVSDADDSVSAQLNHEVLTPIVQVTPQSSGVVVLNVTPPAGEQGNTWFYQVITEDPDAANPYENQTLNTDGAPETFTIEGLTPGATYTVRVANWNGTVGGYSEIIVSIPEEQVIQAPSQPSYISAPDFTPDAPTEPVVEEPVVEEPVVDEPVTEPEPETEEPVVEETDNTEMTADEVQDAVEDLINDGALTDADAEAVIDALLSDGDISVSEISDLASNLTDGGITANEAELILDALSSDGEVTNSEVTALVTELVSEGGLSSAEAELIVDALSADGEITVAEVTNLSEALTEDGTFTLAEKDLVSDVLVSSAEGAPVEAASIAAAGLEYRDLPPAIPVEVREDLNGNPVVITAEVASALLTLESPAALVGAITGCFNPEEAIEGLTEEQQCEVFKALENIGADMSEQERQKAKEVLVAAVLVGQVILGSSILRIRG
jgi:polyhydroxyalkanoate synthesis regulator phasin